MASSSNNRNDVQTDEEDTYRLTPAEPSPVDPPVVDSTSNPIPDEVAWFGSDPVWDKPKRRKRKRKTPADDPTPGLVAGEFPADEQPEWVADTGWRERSLISAVWFPFTGSGTKLLLVYTAMLSVGMILPLIGTVIGMVGLVLLSVLLIETSNYTLEGIPLGPQVPDLLSWGTISVGLMGLIVFMTAGLPMVIGSLIMSLMKARVPWILISLMSAGFFYIPMGCMALAEIEDVKALNPLCVFRGMRKMLLPYLALCGIATGVFLIPLYLLMMFPVPRLVFNGVFAAMLVYVSASLMRCIALVARQKGPMFEEEIVDKASSTGGEDSGR